MHLGVTGAALYACQHPQFAKPEGYELIREEHNRRGKTFGRNQIKGRQGRISGKVEAFYFF